MRNEQRIAQAITNYMPPRALPVMQTLRIEAHRERTDSAVLLKQELEMLGVAESTSPDASGKAFMLDPRSPPPLIHR